MKPARIRSALSCWVCGAELPIQSGPGRSRRFCDESCRYRYHFVPSERGRGRPRGGEYTDSGGYVMVAPTDDAERDFPTGRSDGRLRRSHLVWNRAHPDDLVQPGDHIHHKNRIRDDDRIENLEKLSASEHRARERRAA